MVAQVVGHRLQAGMKKRRRQGGTEVSLLLSPPWRLAWLESGLAKAGRRHVTAFVLQTAGRKAQEPALSAPNLPHALLFF